MSLAEVINQRFPADDAERNGAAVVQRIMAPLEKPRVVIDPVAVVAKNLDALADLQQFIHGQAEEAKERLDALVASFDGKIAAVQSNINDLVEAAISTFRAIENTHEMRAEVERVLVRMPDGKGHG